jgi:hypothetical protein
MILFPPASASIPMRTCAPRPPEDAVIADGGSGHADTIKSYRAPTASHTDLRDYAVRLMNWREHHCLCRRCYSQAKGSNGDQSDHSSLLCEPSNQVAGSPSAMSQRPLCDVLMDRAPTVERQSIARSDVPRDDQRHERRCPNGDYV